jgi:hypothetical protein
MGKILHGLEVLVVHRGVTDRVVGLVARSVRVVEDLESGQVLGSVKRKTMVMWGRFGHVF